MILINDYGQHCLDFRKITLVNNYYNIDNTVTTLGKYGLFTNRGEKYN